MQIKHLKRKRLVLYNDDLTNDMPGILVVKTGVYEAFKLQIWRRDTEPDIGEVNFLIRDPSNNLRFLLAYCFMDEPGRIVSVSFWVNNKVLMPSGEIAYSGKLLDDEKASYFIMDFIERYLKKNYTFVPENLQQY